MHRRKFLQDISLGSICIATTSGWLLQACADDHTNMTINRSGFMSFSGDARQFLIIRSYRYVKDDTLAQRFKSRQAVELDVVASCSKLPARPLSEVLAAYPPTHLVPNIHYHYDDKRFHFNFYNVHVYNRTVRFPVFNTSVSGERRPQTPVVMLLDQARKHFRQPLFDNMLLT
ncbi:hypothetical protein MKQ68_05005 [Chitinophaga horti]|uniref:Uncharacterized protein n=1 Tax=Chitinophaga horti TaxID=2920382 RepID=A0ABY6J771_9BACT|nr:hypothetical protein [Chitinophaga horti]UYQ94447.1 hypothetical protein MKQ68_05005 [Chitinophaga horti]